MWTIYDIRNNRYWNEDEGCWCGIESATRYTPQQRDQLQLSSVGILWKFVPSAS